MHMYVYYIYVNAYIHMYTKNVAKIKLALYVIAHEHESFHVVLESRLWGVFWRHWTACAAFQDRISDICGSLVH